MAAYSEEWEVRREAFVMALQAMATAGVEVTDTEQILAEAERFYDYLKK